MFPKPCRMFPKPCRTFTKPCRTFAKPCWVFPRAVERTWLDCTKSNINLSCFLSFSCNLRSSFATSAFSSPTAQPILVRPDCALAERTLPIFIWCVVDVRSLRGKLDFVVDRIVQINFFLTAERRAGRFGTYMPRLYSFLEFTWIWILTRYYSSAIKAKTLEPTPLPHSCSLWKCNPYPALKQKRPSKTHPLYCSPPVSFFCISSGPIRSIRA
jgi:hypothetical protein